MAVQTIAEGLKELLPVSALGAPFYSASRARWRISSRSSTPASMPRDCERLSLDGTPRRIGRFRHVHNIAAGRTRATRSLTRLDLRRAWLDERHGHRRQRYDAVCNRTTQQHLHEPRVARRHDDLGTFVLDRRAHDLRRGRAESNMRGVCNACGSERAACSLKHLLASAASAAA